MNIVSADQIEDSVWDAFCDASPDAWTRHTSVARRHNLEMSEGRGRDCSFGVMHTDTLVAIVPLLSQTTPDGERLEFSMGSTPAPLPACAFLLPRQERIAALEMAFHEVDRVATEQGVARSRMCVDPLSDPILSGALKTNPLPSFGYHDTSIATVIIDLTKTEGEILAGMASRRRRYISSASRGGQYKIDFFDSHTITAEAFASFEELYTAAAGRRVGPECRWGQYMERLQSGNAFLALVYVGETKIPCAGHYFSSYKLRSYDGLSAIRPEYNGDHSIGSFMQWESIRFLKARGYSHYEIGWQFPPTISEKVYSQKELAISHFKALFGGELLPLFRGEKYYDLDYLREQRAALTEAFVEYQNDLKTET